MSTATRRLGRYELGPRLGAGGAATVYLGRARGIGGFSREVAIKMLHPHLRAEPGLVDDFLREARLAARLRHPNLLPVLDVGEAAEGPFLVMEYVEGLSLSALGEAAEQAGVPLPPALALRILCDALAGLHAAHELRDEAGTPLGLVHRDFSPQNLLVDGEGVTRLTDFGVAKPTRAPSHTESGIVKGKLPYMAPEHLRGGDLDRRTDVWSAGVVVWEVLAGRRLVAAGEDQLAAVLRLCHDDAPPLGSVRPELGAALADAVRWALAREREARCPTAEALRDALERAAPVASTREVAAFVRDVAGEILDARRAGLREAWSGATAGAFEATDETEAAGDASGRPTSPAFGVRRRPAIAALLAAGALLTAAGIGWRRRGRREAVGQEGQAPAAPAPDGERAAEIPPAPRPSRAEAPPPAERDGGAKRRLRRGPRAARPPLAEDPYE